MRDTLLYIIFMAFLILIYFAVEYFERKFHDDFKTEDDDCDTIE